MRLYIFILLNTLILNAFCDDKKVWIQIKDADTRECIRNVTIKINSDEEYILEDSLISLKEGQNIIIFTKDDYFPVGYKFFVKANWSEGTQHTTLNIKVKRATCEINSKDREILSSPSNYFLLDNGIYTYISDSLKDNKNIRCDYVSKLNKLRDSLIIKTGDISDFEIINKAKNTNNILKNFDCVKTNKEFAKIDSLCKTNVCLDTVIILYSNLIDSLKSDINVKCKDEIDQSVFIINNFIYYLNAIKEIHNKEKEKKNFQLLLFSIMGFSFIIVSIILYIFFHQKKRVNKKLDKKNKEIQAQHDEIEAQKDEIVAQRDVVIIQKEKIEEIYKEVSQSIDYAQRIQRSILPDGSILEKYFAEYFVLFRPRDIVSGDFYWATHIEGYTIVTASDCTGHGVPGAFMSMLGISYLREIVQKEYITHPSVILRKLRKEIIRTLRQKGDAGEQKDGMDMALISVNHKTNLCYFAGANNPLYLIRNKELIEFKPDKMPIAIYEKMDKYTMHEIQLIKKDQLYMFSDGFPDQFGGPKGKKFLYKQFKELLLETSSFSMSEQKSILEEKFIEWKGNLDQVDDVIVLGIKI